VAHDFFACFCPFPHVAPGLLFGNGRLSGPWSLPTTGPKFFFLLHRRCFLTPFRRAPTFFFLSLLGGAHFCFPPWSWWVYALLCCSLFFPAVWRLVPPPHNLTQRPWPPPHLALIAAVFFFCEFSIHLLAPASSSVPGAFGFSWHCSVQLSFLDFQRRLGRLYPSFRGGMGPFPS